MSCISISRIFALTILMTGWFDQPLSAFDQTELETDTRFLSQSDHRLSGTPEFDRAADYVVARLREEGASTVFEQPFLSAQTETLECTLELLDLEGEPVAILPLLTARPNGIVPATTFEDGISGELVYAGSGTISEFPKSPEGKIVLLDFNSGSGWLRAFRLGAKAVVFISSKNPESRHSKHVVAPVNMPRFYYDGDVDDLLRVGQGRIRSAEVWRGTQGRNIVVWVSGRSPRLKLAADEVLIVAAPLDSFGSIPRKSPGARGAATVAGLIQWAGELESDRLRRDVLLVFWDNDARGHLGAQSFISSLATNRSKANLERRQDTLGNELEFIRKLSETLENGDLLAAESSVRRELGQRLRRIANRETSGRRDAQYSLMLEADGLPDGDPEKSGIDERIREIDLQRTDWNDLKRALAAFEITADVQTEYDKAVDQLKSSMHRRLQELVIEEEALNGAFRIRDLIGEKEVVLSIDLRASDRRPDWGVLTGGFSRNVNAYWDKPGLYLPVFEALKQAVEDHSENPGAIKHFQIVSAEESLADRHLFSARHGYAYGGEIAGTMGIQNVLFAPAQDDLSWLGTPADHYDSLDLGNLSNQLRDMLRMCRALGETETLSVRSSVLSDAQFVLPRFTKDYRRFGPVVLAQERGSLMADSPSAGAMLMVMHSWPVSPLDEKYEHDESKPPAYDDFFLIRANEEGAYAIGPVDSRLSSAMGFAFAFDQRGNVAFASSLKGGRTANLRMDLFPARSAFFVPPPRFDSAQTKAFDALSDSLLDEDKSLGLDLDGVFMLHYEAKVKRVKAFGPQSLSALNLSRIEVEIDSETGEVVYDRDRALGFGYDPSTGMPPIMAADRAAGDLVNLDSFRLEQLRSNEIFNSSIDELHGQATDLLSESRQTESVAKGESRAALAYHLSRSVYDHTARSIKDLVSAVIVLLLLAIPFAFAMERLLLGATVIYRQVWGFVVFFALAFGILYWTHPAFAISATPMVIFLGFIIVLLSVLVIVIIMRKFEHELLALQGMGTTVHTADVSRLGTMMAAMSMGISTMRRRPVRTALTITTIVLLTFTLLTFSSFGGSLGLSRTYRGPVPAYSAVLVKKMNWDNLNDSFVDLLYGQWGDEAVVAPRCWVTEQTDHVYPTRAGVLLSTEDLDRSLALRGVLGLTDGELGARRDIARLLQPPEDTLEGQIWITRSAAERLGVEAGGVLLVAGRSLVVGRLLETRDLVQIVDMDGSSMLPVDLASFGAAADGLSGDADGGASYKLLSADSVAIVSEPFALTIGGLHRLAHIYTESTTQAGLIADDLTRSTQQPISVTREDGVYRQIFGTIIAASGLRDLFLPIILGGMVIFGTMLGSVADREKEIYTFSALGLAPPHVASLFFAEALVFSIVGGLGGYLISQIVNQGLVWAAQRGLIDMPEMNFSTFNAVITLIIVMLVVLASAIYPAVKASKSANPGVMRNWKMPPPQGDLLELVFPFTVSVYDVTGVVSFLREHFDNCSDVGLGNFMTMETRLLHEADNYGLRARIALAPFDLGVTQTFDLISHPSELAGIDEVKILIKRLSGQPKDWARLNKTLVNDLRKQFLIWRSLPREIMEEYRQRTLHASEQEETV